MKHFLKGVLIGLIPLAVFYLGMLTAAYQHIKNHKCPPTKGEFQGSTFIDADHIERTWVYRDTVEYSRPKINFNL